MHISIVTTYGNSLDCGPTSVSSVCRTDPRDFSKALDSRGLRPPGAARLIN